MNEKKISLLFFSLKKLDFKGFRNFPSLNRKFQQNTKKTVLNLKIFKFNLQNNY